MTRFATIVFDVGGVCLTNGWDTSARRSAALHFSLDLEEFEKRHQALVDALERDEGSCYVGVRKPGARIYEIALDVMQSAPTTSLFVDDREENVEGARALGIHAIHVTDLRRLTEQLMHAGVEVPMPGPVSARTHPNVGERSLRDETTACEE